VVLSIFVFAAAIPIEPNDRAYTVARVRPAGLLDRR
jgi:hypothetical protein